MPLASIPTQQKNSFYLVANYTTSIYIGGGDVATFKYKVIDDAPFSIHDLEFLPLPGT